MIIGEYLTGRAHMVSNARRPGNATSSTRTHARTAMKRWTLLLIVGVALVVSGCGVTMQTASNGGAAPTPTLAVAAGDPSLFVFLRGTYGTFQTVDDGVHWSQPSTFTLSGAIAHLTDAISATTRWDAASTTDGTSSVVTVARTNDNGHTWHSVALPTFTQPYLQPSDMQFLDATHGWLEIAVGPIHLRDGLLFSTQDGGATWTSSALPFTGSMTFTSPSVGWLVGSDWATLNNTLVGTHDGGKTWIVQTLPLPQGIAATHTVVGLPRFFDRQKGIVPVNIGQSTVLYATRNGGASWAQAATLANFTGDDQAQPVDASFGRSAWVAVGHSLFTTRDAGATWAAVDHDAHFIGVESLLMRSDTQAFALTENGTCASFKSNCAIHTTLLRTSDGGHTWIPLLTSASPFK